VDASIWQTDLPPFFSRVLFSCALNLRFSLSAGIWSRPVSEDDLLKWESLAIGPALSPYAFGFFTFRMQVTCIFSRASSRRCPVFFSQSCCWTRTCRSGVQANKEKDLQHSSFTRLQQVAEVSTEKVSVRERTP